MRILVAGASGFIGAALADALAARGHHVVMGVRDAVAAADRWPERDAIAIDYASDDTPAAWRPRLAGIDVVVNAVGILRSHGAQSFEAIHVRGPVALFRACAEAGVRRVVQVSALGADAGAASGYHRSKARADAVLAGLPVASTIVRPSLVFDADGASARWFSMLAALPVVPLPAGGAQCLQPIHRDDLVAALVRLVEAPEAPAVVDAVGPRGMPLRDYLAALRAGLGLGRLRSVAVPRFAMRVAAAVGERLGGLVDRETLGMLDRGNCAPADGIAGVLGRAPRDPADFITGPARDLLRQRAQLDWLLPVLRWAVALTWIATGLVSLFVYPREASLALLARTGLDGTLALVALYGAGLLDLVLGLATLAARTRRAAYVLQALLMLGYTGIITVSLPEFWWHPYGPVLKNLPLLAATWLLYRLDTRR